jgi:hypothetical protein
MKVLAISHLPEEKFSSRQHLGFLRLLSNYCEYEFLSGYTIFQNNWKAVDIYDRYRPDVVILYDSHAPKGQRPLFPVGFFSPNDATARWAGARPIGSPPFAGLPKVVMLEVDFWKMAGANPPSSQEVFGNMQWYTSNQFDLIIRRGCFKGRKDVDGIPSVWLPFSASNEFFPQTLKRIQKVGFAGAFAYNKEITDGIIAYGQRRKAMQLLEDAKLLVRCPECRSLNGSREFYPQFLRSTVMSLTSAEVRSIHGKAFEIMASGTVLLTPDFDHKHALFGDTECFVEYKADCSDIVEKAKEILTNLKKQARISENAVEVIKKYHTSEKRIAELYEHLSNLVSNKPLTHRWEV